SQRPAAPTRGRTDRLLTNRSRCSSRRMRHGHKEDRQRRKIDPATPSDAAQRLQREGANMAERNRRLVLAERPTGMVDEQTVRMEEVDAPQPGDGEALARVRYISIDPTIRTW